MSLKQRLQQTAFWLTLARWVVPVVLVIVLAVVLVDTLWLVLFGPTEPVPPAPKLPQLEASVGTASTLALRHGQVRQWNLFGTWQVRSNRVQQKGPIQAPETDLELKLLGVFQTEGAGRAGAIIARKGEEGKLYRVGDRVPGDARLAHVYADRVILRQDGHLETLKMAGSGLKGGGIRRVEPKTKKPSSPAPTQTASTAMKTGVSARLAQKRQRIIQGLGLKATPRGYVIGESAPSWLLQKVGLRPGDVIVSVNGYDVGTRQADLKALREYYKTGHAKVVVKRGSQRFVLTLPP